MENGYYIHYEMDVFKHVVMFSQLVATKQLGTWFSLTNSPWNNTNIWMGLPHELDGVYNGKC